MEGALKEKKRLDERDAELMLETHNAAAKVERPCTRWAPDPRARSPRPTRKRPSTTSSASRTSWTTTTTTRRRRPGGIRRGRRGRLDAPNPFATDQASSVDVVDDRAQVLERGVGDGPTPVPAKQGEEASVRAVPRGKD